MRPFLLALGGLWFLFWAAMGFRVGAVRRAPPLSYERAAMPLPAPPPPVAPTPTAARQTTPAPATLPAPSGSETARSPAAEPPAPGTPDTPPAVPLRRPGEFRPAPLPSVAASAPAPSPALPQAPAPEARCLLCGRPAESWVEIGGARRGYCRAHYSVPAPAIPAPAGPQSPDAAPDGADEPRTDSARSATQCRGVTRSGARCRRKTTDPSGYCYQHRGQAGSAPGRGGG